MNIAQRRLALAFLRHAGELGTFEGPLLLGMELTGYQMVKVTAQIAEALPGCGVTCTHRTTDEGVMLTITRGQDPYELEQWLEIVCQMLECDSPVMDAPPTEQQADKTSTGTGGTHQGFGGFGYNQDPMSKNKTGLGHLLDDFVPDSKPDAIGAVPDGGLSDLLAGPLGDFLRDLLCGATVKATTKRTFVVTLGNGEELL